MKHLIFVYGTLKLGHSRSRHLAPQRYLGVATTLARYRMYRLGGCPGMVEEIEKPGVCIYGELYEVNDECLARLDEIEGVSHNVYERRIIDLDTVTLSFLPLDEKVFQMLKHKQALAYIFKQDVEGAKDCGAFWPLA